MNSIRGCIAEIEERDLKNVKTGVHRSLTVCCAEVEKEGPKYLDKHAPRFDCIAEMKKRVLYI